MSPEKKIKVLFITKWFMNRRDVQNGVFIRKHASAAALYCDVALLCVLSDEFQENKFEFEAVNEYGVKGLVVYFKKYSSQIKILEQAVNGIRYFKGVRAGIHKIKKTFGAYDITHSYIMLRPAIVAYWLKLWQRKPFVISEQWSGYATGKYAERNGVAKLISKWIFKKAGGVTAVSEFLKNKIRENGLANKIFFVTNNVVEIFPKTISPLPANSNLKILVVADLKDDIKNISGVIKAVAPIYESGDATPFDLHIVGHGKDEEMLKKIAMDLKLLNRIIFFHGVKTNEEVFQYLHACDFLVMNSRFETFSLICAEAIACGKPVIATRCGGPQEFVTAENGILINPDSPDELKNAIQKMMKDYINYNSELLRKNIIAKFSSEKIGEVFYSIYKSILRR